MRAVSAAGQTGAGHRQLETQDPARQLLAVPEEVARLRRNAMRRDVSWAGPARAYEALYRRLLAG